MAKRSVLLALRDIERTIDEMVEILDGADLGSYRESLTKRRAIERCVEIVSEASRKVPEELKQQHAQVPWEEIKAIGNLLRHKYLLVDDQIIWRIATTFAPKLRVVVQEMIATVESRR